METALILIGFLVVLVGGLGFVFSESGASVTLNGKEVRNPILRGLVAAIITLAGMFGAIIAILVMPLSLLVFGFVLVFTFPFHLLLKALGRRGFVVRDGLSLSYLVSRAGFRRAQPRN